MSGNEEYPIPKIHYIRTRPNSLRIALASFCMDLVGQNGSRGSKNESFVPLVTHKENKDGSHRHGSHTYKLSHIAPERLDQVRGGYQYAIEEAVKHRANIVCFNELSFPFDPSRKRKNASFVRSLQALAQQHGIFIVAGSHHDTDSCHNMATIFSPDGTSSPIYQIKWNPALGVGEEIASPDKNELKAVATPFDGYLAVLICLDAGDNNCLKKLQVRGEKDKFKDIDFIFVPAMDKSGQVWEYSRKLSYTTNSCVAFVNYRTRPRERRSKHAEVFVPAAANSARNQGARCIEPKERIESNDPCRPWIYLFEFDPQKELSWRPSKVPLPD